MKTKNINGVPQDKKLLYIGTTERVAKLAPNKGLEPPVFLTDVYPGFFCKQSCKNERWGIISVNLEQLYTEMLAPSPIFIEKSIKNKAKEPLEERLKKIFANITVYKSKWQKSLNNCGVCLYLSHIPPKAIQKIMIYSAVGRDANSAINKLVDELPEPCSVSPSEHKSNYPKSLGVLKWFNGDMVKCEDIFNGKTNINLINEIDDKLNNRFGLDVFYIKPEEKGRKNVSKPCEI